MPRKPKNPRDWNTAHVGSPETQMNTTKNNKLWLNHSKLLRPIIVMLIVAL